MSGGGMQLNDLQKDALKEVGNIGAGHAATALSQLLNTKINLSEPRIDVIKFRDLASRVGHENRTVAALHMYVRGEAPGQMVVLDREQALDFVSQFLHRVIGDIQIFDSIADSTLNLWQHHRRFVSYGDHPVDGIKSVAERSDALVRHGAGRIPHADVDSARPRCVLDREQLPRQRKSGCRPVYPDSGNRIARTATLRLRGRVGADGFVEMDRSGGPRLGGWRVRRAI